jgi:hypothetical protein
VIGDASEIIILIQKTVSILNGSVDGVNTSGRV